MDSRPGLHPSLQVRDALQGVVPSGFELSGDQAVFRIGRVVLALRPRRLVASFFQGQFEGLALVVVLPSFLLPGFQCRCDSDRLHRVQHPGRHRFVETEAADIQAAPIYTHVLNRGPAGVMSPADRVLDPDEPGPTDPGPKGDGR